MLIIPPLTEVIEVVDANSFDDIRLKIRKDTNLISFSGSRFA